MPSLAQNSALVVNGGGSEGNAAPLPRAHRGGGAQKAEKAENIFKLRK